MSLLPLVGSILESGPICDHCLGRLFARRSFGLSNAERGHALRVAHALDAHIRFTGYERGTCFVCSDLFTRIDSWAARVADALDGIEHDTFVIGTRVPPMMAESEEMLWSDFSLGDPEPLKSEMNREVGKAVAALTGKTGDPKNPEVTVILNIAEEKVEVQIAPVFFHGRYRKLERGIPQTHWDCRSCRGAGCPECGGLGKQYPDSVEELIGTPAIGLFQAAGAILHGAGREDIDALMVGSGRPFIMEIPAPRKRQIDLGDLESAINTAACGRVTVTLTRWSGRREVETLKSHKAHKTYRILVDIEGHTSPKTVKKALEALNGAVISQRTPQRVSHRRADRIRERMVVGIRCLGVEDDRYLIEVIGEAGLYIKELVSGDNGRTNPSLSEILGIPATVLTLDVIAVEGMPENGEE
ncbi:MAG: tRNA pseudouridine(54/55) synthase Pus10 [Methanocalculus sp. MSAO_Arc1]|uniref:tRNA pseudouridine(54/55) synthase Pus10 n=1 Tax=Methanocalculus TaxID=71151 RepID=UPI000FEDE6AD|nr:MULTISPECIES: tRNA pseudouridine(54/55) synthase Pus10 [unclassified Methanocalculus]RQD79586.1 MAG: tRNA pseudouridine(54/55) synthase Pus10 [Methanocalculus sp. MSAO_Arc1]